MVPFKNEIYAKGDINHFPIALPHSVDTAPAYMGTTLTLAHTGVPTTDTSIAYYKEAFTSLPSLHFESVEAFKASIDLRIAQLQVLDLQDNLSTFLNARQQNNQPLTPDETRHLRDTHEYNYVETSLLPALAIYNMEKSMASSTGSSRPTRRNFSIANFHRSINVYLTPCSKVTRRT